MRLAAKHILPTYLKKSSSRVRRTEIPSEKIIISLTSFPARVNTLWMTIQCLRRQTVQPSKILIWLSKSQFGNNYNLPDSLSTQLNEQVEIRWVENDLRSHKKFYYVSSLYPNSWIFLVDDDIFYPSDMLEEVLKIHQSHPDAVICRYGYKMKHDANGNLLSYWNWKKKFSYSSESELFFGTGGGTLFRPSSLYKDLTNESLFLNLTPLSDDIWMNAMVRLAKRPVIITKNGLLLPFFISENICLDSENLRNNRNDQQLQMVSAYYKMAIGIDPFQKISD